MLVTTDVQALCPLSSVAQALDLNLFYFFLALPTRTDQPWVVSVAVLFGLCLNLGSLLELDWLAREPPVPVSTPVSPHLAFPWVLQV